MPTMLEMYTVYSLDIYNFYIKKKCIRKRAVHENVMHSALVKAEVKNNIFFVFIIILKKNNLYIKKNAYI